eukprot:TRINITY_DN2872_c0_g2_i2.p2 TRINITY_DN2872_c0_g2~~TRINITY_DN2872_c0_g2_i2.p2  ORF type:complete len:303 (-),score=35.18 TRINITY_DN2872_c0_g2_i2:1185-2093(-)
MCGHSLPSIMLRIAQGLKKRLEPRRPVAPRTAHRGFTFSLARCAASRHRVASSSSRKSFKKIGPPKLGFSKQRVSYATTSTGDDASISHEPKNPQYDVASSAMGATDDQTTLQPRPGVSQPTFEAMFRQFLRSSAASLGPVIDVGDRLRYRDNENRERDAIASNSGVTSLRESADGSAFRLAGRTWEAFVRDLNAQRGKFINVPYVHTLLEIELKDAPEGATSFEFLLTPQRADLIIEFMDGIRLGRAHRMILSGPNGVSKSSMIAVLAAYAFSPIASYCTFRMAILWLLQAIPEYLYSIDS